MSLKPENKQSLKIEDEDESTINEIAKGSLAASEPSTRCDTCTWWWRRQVTAAGGGGGRDLQVNANVGEESVTEGGVFTEGG